SRSIAWDHLRPLPPFILFWLQAPREVDSKSIVGVHASVIGNAGKREGVTPIHAIPRHSAGGCIRECDAIATHALDNGASRDAIARNILHANARNHPSR